MHHIRYELSLKYAMFDFCLVRIIHPSEAVQSHCTADAFILDIFAPHHITAVRQGTKIMVVPFYKAIDRKHLAHSSMLSDLISQWQKDQIQSIRSVKEKQKILVKNESTQNSAHFVKNWAATTNSLSKHQTKRTSPDKRRTFTQLLPDTAANEQPKIVDASGQWDLYFHFHLSTNLIFLISQRTSRHLETDIDWNSCRLRLRFTFWLVYLSSPLLSFSWSLILIHDIFFMTSHMRQFADLFSLSLL